VLAASRGKANSLERTVSRAVNFRALAEDRPPVHQLEGVSILRPRHLEVRRDASLAPGLSAPWPLTDSRLSSEPACRACSLRCARNPLDDRPLGVKYLAVVRADGQVSPSGRRSGQVPLPRNPRRRGSPVVAITARRQSQRRWRMPRLIRMTRGMAHTGRPSEPGTPGCRLGFAP